MKIYITRHGQVVTRGIDGNVQYPVGDPYLSELGRQQATRLGAWLKHLGFAGKIYTSPYARALETAECIAEQTGSLIVPWAPMREIVKSWTSIQEFQGLTMEQIRQKYTHIDPEAEMPYPWWTTKEEEPEDVIVRVKAGLDALDPKEDIMLVGHGASSYCACEVLEIPHKGGDGYNCSYTMYDSEDKTNFKRMDPGHLPYKMRTFNTIYQADEDKKLLDAFLEEGIAIPEEIKAAKTGKLLHIGDTHSVHYPYIQKLIEEIKPNIIIHTGDFSDEVKVGRSIGVFDEYTENVARLAQILKNSGAEKIYAVPGNNDVWEVLEEQMPFAELLQPNSVVKIGGVSCALGHSCIETNAPAQWSFYGHGLTGETWNPEDNDVREGICRFNVIKGISVILLEERKHFRFPRPKTYYWGKV